MAKKHLGQNFLKSGKALRDMVAAADLGSSDTVLEVGPGKGALTRHLLDSGGAVIAIEKDKDLLPLLGEVFNKELAEGRLTLIEGDILRFDLSSLPRGYKVVANIPFYITGAIIERLLSSEYHPSAMVLVVQKEVAERIVARDGKESILSMSVKVFGEPKYIGKIPARYFSPEPLVDSAILSINDIRHNLGPAEEQRFFTLVKAGFAQKRKTVARNLANAGIPKEVIEASLAEMRLPLDIRAEKLTLFHWLLLTKALP